MSVENNVFLSRENMPTPNDWADAIKRFGFDMELDTDFNVDEFEGFLPCKYKGNDAGFEYYSEYADFQELKNDGLLSDEELSQLAGKTFLVTFITHSDYNEFASAAIAAGVLCYISSGLWADEGEPPFITPESAIQNAKEIEEHVKNETG